jgi:plastocyanin
MYRISTIARRGALAGSFAAALALGLAACGSSSDNAAGASNDSSSVTTPSDTGATATPAPTTAPAAKLTIKSNAVAPGKLTVTPGEKVNITNSDKVVHELADSKNKLSTGNIKADGSGTLTAPNKAGTFKLVDPKHSATHLTLIVS